MNKNIAPLYRKFKASGLNANQSLQSAKTVYAFQQLEAEGLVRMRAEPETDCYLDVHGEPEAYTAKNGKRVSAEQAKKELIEILDRYGCWWTTSEYLDENGEWQQADSCGMHTGYENVLCPFQNCYVVDEMAAAVRAAGKRIFPI